MQRTIVAFVLCLGVPAFAAPPQLTSVETVLGPKLFQDGDVIEITDVSATSSKLEQGDSVIVKGRVRLESRASASLDLYLTQTKGDGAEETDKTQRMSVTKGLQEFKLKITIKHKGKLHLTMYDAKTGLPFGGVYFGTADQMKEIEKWDLNYYLKN